MAELKITQVRSTIGARWRQRESLRTLGLRKIRQSVVREDTEQTRGLIKIGAPPCRGGGGQKMSRSNFTT